MIGNSIRFYKGCLDNKNVKNTKMIEISSLLPGVCILTLKTKNKCSIKQFIKY